MAISSILGKRNMSLILRPLCFHNALFVSHLPCVHAQRFTTRKEHSLKIQKKYSANIYKQSGDTKSASKKRKTPIHNTDGHGHGGQLLSDIADISKNAEHTKGWNGAFYKCAHLVSYNPLAIFNMMNTFNFTSATSVFILWSGFFYLRYAGIYSFPVAWLCAWSTVRIFSDIFPLIPYVNCRLIDKYAYRSFPVLQHLTFSRKLPNPEQQSLSAMIHANRRQRESSTKSHSPINQKHETNLDDLEFTDEMLANTSIAAKWRIRQRQYAKKYGISYDIADNASTLVLLPFFMSCFQIIGINDTLLDHYLSDEFGGIVCRTLSKNDWILNLCVSYSAAIFFNRLLCIPLFRYYCVSRFYKKYSDPFKIS